MTVPFSNTNLRAPNGFQNIIWVFAREVIRDNPQNIHEYGFRFFTKLLQIRAIEGHDPAQTGAHSEDRFYNNWAYKESAGKEDKSRKGVSFDAEPEVIDIDGNDAATEHAAVVIQAQFKGYAARKKYSIEIEERRQSVSEKAKEDAEEEIDIDLNDPAVEDAAVMIQAQFKGIKKRKDVGRSKGQEPGTS